MAYRNHTAGGVLCRHLQLARRGSLDRDWHTRCAQVVTSTTCTTRLVRLTCVRQATNTRAWHKPHTATLWTQRTCTPDLKWESSRDVNATTLPSAHTLPLRQRRVPSDIESSQNRFLGTEWGYQLGAKARRDSMQAADPCSDCPVAPHTTLYACGLLPCRASVSAARGPAMLVACATSASAAAQPALTKTPAATATVLGASSASSAPNTATASASRTLLLRLPCVSHRARALASSRWLQRLRQRLCLRLRQRPPACPSLVETRRLSSCSRT